MGPVTWEDSPNSKMTNTFKTTLLLTALTVLLIVAGQYPGGRTGLLTALIVAVAMNFGACFYSDKVALALYRAKSVTRAQLPDVYNAVERLTQCAGLPMPKIYLIPSNSPNGGYSGFALPVWRRRLLGLTHPRGQAWMNRIEQ
jgi:heat shock protein HtpX